MVDETYLGPGGGGGAGQSPRGPFPDLSVVDVAHDVFVAMTVVMISTSIPIGTLAVLTSRIR